MRKSTVFVAAMLLAGPAVAQSGPAPTAATPAEKPQMCEMMHKGAKMEGMMAKGKDGKMTCQMMDHAQKSGSQMNHGMMDHSQMGHGEMKTPQPQPDSTPKSAVPPADDAAKDHTSHPGHGPG